MASTVQDTGCCHSGKAILYAAGFVLGGAAIGYYIGYKYALCKARVNKKVQLANEKVVDTVDVEDIGEKKAFCRCWKSEKFPYCDGAHTKHNKETGDNVGPLLVKVPETLVTIPPCYVTKELVQDTLRARPDEVL
ncbi:zinc finger CDGSH type [Oesophagostomum dentatum]|uniref:CDGSH iron-sulfur domain-containing protein 2 homologue n=1 Tax=Oesophagostomum dentatum TaxID=61180 RepID=A0A0B1SVN0_OESDE|nr:zinc finger CDGSH type [Oesophagostomum dentatum]